LLIGERTAEEIKIRIGSATKLDSPLTMEVRGRHIGKGVPKKVVVSDAEIREWMDGNMCRCGVYQNVVRAVQSLAAGRQ
jgi:actin-like ATPase involved in cell morphogenesis